MAGSPAEEEFDHVVRSTFWPPVAGVVLPFRVYPVVNWNPSVVQNLMPHNDSWLSSGALSLTFPVNRTTGPH